VSTANGAVGVLAPHVMKDEATGTYLTISEIKLFGDGCLRWMSYGDAINGGQTVLNNTSTHYTGVFLPNFEHVPGPQFNYGLTRIDHIVNNVPNLFDAVDYLMGATGFHEFAEFTADDVGTVDSGLNSMVVSNNSEYVLLPINEPTHGTKRKSQIQTYLEQNNGAGVQHIAIKTNDIFATMKELRHRSYIGGFEFMPPPPKTYYERCRDRIGKDVLTEQQWKELEELGLLADRDDQGVLLQVFTKPLGDRMTVFIEVIQRVGCDRDKDNCVIEQMAGCGGFGKGNFSELFKSIEEYEKQCESKSAM